MLRELSSHHNWCTLLKLKLLLLPSALGSTQSGLKNVTNLTLKEWLTDLRLVEYMPTFQDNLYSEMDRVKNIWDDELVSLLDIEKIGHRKRILLSLAGREGMLNRFGKVQVCILHLLYFMMHKVAWREVKAPTCIMISFLLHTYLAATLEYTRIHLSNEFPVWLTNNMS